MRGSAGNPYSPYCVGLTGGIGSGKSAAAEAFAARGAMIVDTDLIAHELTAPGGAALGQIAAAFGSGVLNAAGALDRAHMRQRVFADPSARQRLEAILHPLIRVEAQRRVASAESCYVVLVVPLLIESADYRQRVDRIAVVDCPDEMRVARVMARSGLERSEVARIMAAQTSRSARLAAADDIIENSGTLEKLTTRIVELDGLYRQLAANKP